MPTLLDTTTESLGRDGGTTQIPINSFGASAITVAVSYFNATPIDAINDSAGNIWTAGLDVANGSQRTRLFRVLSPVIDLSHTVTVLKSGGFVAVTFSAWADVLDFDSEAGKTTDSGAGSPGASITPGVDGALIINSAYSADSAGGRTPSAPYSLLGWERNQSGVNVGNATAYYEQPTAGPSAVTWPMLRQADVQTAFTPAAPSLFNPAWAARAARVITGMGAGA